ncbi:hypothetical protein EUX98_g5582 [Antrodiella citrinella]|uniref:G-protein coupled receptors family 1 profile domain-containing protein n=1 Tax=Antrodiella citrinella TaxID=2447956 RepID=A0A4S4MTB6_9APHY|nr:hypothetical protein EUX98_g5582 [Antrodiella citrinella]
MLTLSEAAIISTTLQGLLHGFAIFMFLLTIFILTRGRRRRRLNIGMLVASSTLMILSTTEFLTNVIRLFRGFFTVGPRLTGGVEAFFSKISEPTFVVKGCLHPIQILILDGAVIYRAYIAWQTPWALLVPGVGWGCGLGLIYALVTAYKHPESVFAARTANWIIAVYATTLATNVTATALLAFRLWKVDRGNKADREGSRLAIVLRVVVEAGVIYTVVNIVTLATFLRGSVAVYIIRDIIPPTISIVFNMIIVRVGFLTSRKLTVLGMSDLESSHHHPSALKFASSDAPETSPTNHLSRRNRSDSVIEMKSLADQISNFFDTERSVISREDRHSRVNIQALGISDSTLVMKDRP